MCGYTYLPWLIFKKYMLIMKKIENTWWKVRFFIPQLCMSEKRAEIPCVLTGAPFPAYLNQVCIYIYVDIPGHIYIYMYITSLHIFQPWPRFPRLESGRHMFAYYRYICTLHRPSLPLTHQCPKSLCY